MGDTSPFGNSSLIIRDWVALFAFPERHQPGGRQDLFLKSKKTKDIIAITPHYVIYRADGATGEDSGEGNGGKDARTPTATIRFALEMEVRYENSLLITALLS